MHLVATIDPQLITFLLLILHGQEYAIVRVIVQIWL